MKSVWKGNFGGVKGYTTSGQTATLTLSSGDVLSSIHKITSISVTQTVSVQSYSNWKTSDVICSWFYIYNDSGYSTIAATTGKKGTLSTVHSADYIVDNGTSQKITFAVADSINAARFNKETLYANASVYTNDPDSSSYMRAVTVTVNYEYAYTKCTAPTTLTLSATSTGFQQQVTLSWSGAKAGTSNAITGYQIYSSDTQTGSYGILGKKIQSTKTSGSATVSARAAKDATRYFKIVTIGTADGYDSGKSSTSVCLTAKAPTIKTQPVINALTTAKGQSIAVTCSKAEFNYPPKQGYTINYQWFCGTANGYNDDHLIETTTTTSYTFSEANLLAQGATGASTDGTPMYLYVRAHYVKDDSATTIYTKYTNISDYKTFYYFPKIKPPTNVTIDSTSGQSTLIKWTNVDNTSNVASKTYICVNGVPIDNIDKSSYATHGYQLTQAQLGQVEGNKTLTVQHEWYGTVANSSAVTFYYDIDKLVKYYDNNEWKNCQVYYYTGTKWELVYPYVYIDNEWKLCDI